jgi:beta-glucanase (GH16 family)
LNRTILSTHRIPAAAALACALAIAAPALAQSPERTGWRLVWSDEFTGATLDPSKWNAENIAWPYNSELQFYRPQQATVGNGVLKIEADDQPYGGRNYISARINTRGHHDQQYGRFESRMILPAGQGYWPAFWLLPSTDAWPPELDIMELIGSNPNTVYFTQHWGTVQNVMSYGITWTGPNFTTGYHNFALEWSPNRVDWFVDGILRHTTTSNFPHEPMYVILNLAVGGHLPGNPNASTVFPKSMLVDWVRVYMRDVLLLNPGFEDAGAAGPAAPASWQTFGNAQRSAENPITGQSSARLFGIAGNGPYYSGVFQDLPASPGQEWSASVVARHTQASRLLPGNHVVLKIEWNNRFGQQIGFEEVTAISNTSPLDTAIPASITATAPPNTATARIALVFVQTGTGAGSAFLDDVTFDYATPGNPVVCPADFNGANGVNVADIFSFLAAWFAGDPRADFNEQDGINVADIFSYLGFWFQGCP